MYSNIWPTGITSIYWITSLFWVAVIALHKRFIRELTLYRLTTRLILLVASILLLSSSTIHAARLHKEKEYQQAWCLGETEVRMPNGTRADCITDKYAIEIEFASKWAEAIGQAINYSEQTGKKPGILLIIEKPKDWRYYNRLKRIALKQNIRLWHITPKRLHN